MLHYFDKLWPGTMTTLLSYTLVTCTSALAISISLVRNLQFGISTMWLYTRVHWLPWLQPY